MGYMSLKQYMGHSKRSGTVSILYRCLLKDVSSCESHTFTWTVTEEGQVFQWYGFIHSSVSENRENETAD